jgi:hypothetical protein
MDGKRRSPIHRRPVGKLTGLLNQPPYWARHGDPAAPKTAREDAGRLVDVLEPLGHHDRAHSVLTLAG